MIKSGREIISGQPKFSQIIQLYPEPTTSDDFLLLKSIHLIAAARVRNFNAKNAQDRVHDFKLW